MLYYTDRKYKKYSWLSRGSDERQYCAPGIDLPIATIMRSKYGTYPEYHTSLDKIGTVVTQKGLKQSFDLFKKVIFIIENNKKPTTNIICEPMLSKRNLYPTFSTKKKNKDSSNILNFLSFCDGNHSLLDISEKILLSFKKTHDYYLLLKSHKLLK